jgi:hypothetical protein
VVEALAPVVRCSLLLWPTPSHNCWVGALPPEEDRKSKTGRDGQGDEMERTPRAPNCVHIRPYLWRLWARAVNYTGWPTFWFLSLLIFLFVIQKYLVKFDCSELLSAGPQGTEVQVCGGTSPLSGWQRWTSGRDFSYPSNEFLRSKHLGTSSYSATLGKVFCERPLFTHHG